MRQLQMLSQIFPPPFFLEKEKTIRRQKIQSEEKTEKNRNGIERRDEKKARK